MQAEPTAQADLSPARGAIPEVEAFAIQVVICDAAGRPSRQRLLNLSDCLGALPPLAGRAA